MKNKIKFVSLFMTSIVSLCLIACGDTEDSDNKEIINMADQHIIRIKYSTNKDKTYVVSYTYDDLGRVIRYTDTQNNGMTNTYTYGDNQISYNTNIGGGFRNFFLKDGRITYEEFGYGTSPSESYTYNYDSNGHLLTKVSSYYNANYKWTAGNLTQIESGASKETIEYSSYSWPMHYMTRNINGMFSDIMMAGGYLGKRPKNLPNKITITNNEGDVTETTFNYTMEDGYPVRVDTKTVFKDRIDEVWNEFIWN